MQAIHVLKGIRQIVSENSNSTGMNAPAKCMVIQRIQSKFDDLAEILYQEFHSEIFQQ